MTTPSQNTDTGVPVATYREQWERRADGTETLPVRSGLVFNQGWRRNIRAASVTSPVRPDGSRGPRAWENRWGNMAHTERTVVYRQPQSGGRYIYRRLVKVPVVGLSSIAAYVSACGASWVNGSGSFDYSSEGQARTKYRLALVDGRAEWGVTLGEMRETVRGINTYCSGVLDLVDYLSTLTRRTKRAVVDEILGIPPRTKKTPPWKRGKDRLIIDHWLAYQFAAKPLLGDIQTSGEALSDLIFERRIPMRFTLKRGGSSERMASVVLNGYPYSPGYTGTGLFHVKSQCHISCVHEVVSGATRSLEQVGLTNPLSIAWELTTLSWAVDYVSTMGDWINSLAPIHGASFVEGSISRVMRVRSDGPVSNVRPVPGFEHVSGSIAGIRSNLVAGRFLRQVLGSTPEPAMGPVWRPRLGLTRMANLLAVTTKLLQ